MTLYCYTEFLHWLYWELGYTVKLGVGTSAVKTAGKSDQTLSRRVRQVNFHQFLRVVQRDRTHDVGASAVKTACKPDQILSRCV